MAVARPDLVMKAIIPGISFDINESKDLLSFIQP
jgi:hypothetical protein